MTNSMVSINPAWSIPPIIGWKMTYMHIEEEKEKERRRKRKWRWEGKWKRQCKWWKPEKKNDNNTKDVFTDNNENDINTTALIKFTSANLRSTIEFDCECNLVFVLKSSQFLFSALSIQYEGRICGSGRYEITMLVWRLLLHWKEEKEQNNVWRQVLTWWGS